MNLVDTIELMISDNYKDRFKAEYYQLKYRLEHLTAIYEGWDNLDFQPTMDKQFYKKQIDAMTEYLNLLKIRAKKEEVDL